MDSIFLYAHGLTPLKIILNGFYKNIKSLSSGGAKWLRQNSELTYFLLVNS